MRHARSIKLVPEEPLSPPRTARARTATRSDADAGARPSAPAATRSGAAATRRESAPPPDKTTPSLVVIHTDGACKGNPGPGGWGAVLRAGDHVRELFGGERLTTNNRMELTAVIEALAALKRRCHVVLHTDSQYVKQGITEWLPNWVRRNWRTADNKPVKNVDLWMKLAQLAAQHDVDWRWVRGHAGDPGNERADELANRGVAVALGKAS